MEYDTKEQYKYCINQCSKGKKKYQELLQTCDSIFDAVDDMQKFTEGCHKNFSCSFDNYMKKEC